MVFFAPGIPAEQLALHAYGDEQPIVPTAPGVLEPRNRRVEVVFKPVHDRS